MMGTSRGLRGLGLKTEFEASPCGAERVSEQI